MSSSPVSSAAAAASSAPSPAVLRIALVGEASPDIVAHRAIPLALLNAAAAQGRMLDFLWIGTSELVQGTGVLDGFDGLWCVPGSPYRSLTGVLAAIGWARRRRRPFLGSCGGFQHAILEHALTDLGWEDAAHAESDPDAARPVIAPLACGLVEAVRQVRLDPGSRLAAACGATATEEAYRCRYGVVPALAQTLFAGDLRAVGWVGGEPDAAGPAAGPGEVHAVERVDHPFFVATLFQSERRALQGLRVPVAEAFVAACGTNRS